MNFETERVLVSFTKEKQNIKTMKMKKFFAPALFVTLGAYMISCGSGQSSNDSR
jgi:hypothetical protein